jgi:shikimate dehydrogenase
MRKLFAVLGDPVAHSRSPKIHSRAFELLGVDAVYAPCHVRAADLATAVAGLRALGCAGFNATVPHKEALAKLVDRMQGDAARIGAVNCVAREDDALVGHNTDAPGLLRALRAAAIDPGGRAVVVGAGGSARAAAFALTRGQLTILNRTASRARELAAAVGAGHAELSSDAARRALREAALVVQCTTVGLDSDELPFDPAQLGARAAVVDLVYRGATGETALVQASRARGLRAVDGLDVLVHQAIASLEIWLGHDDLSRMAGALREAALS